MAERIEINGTGKIEQGEYDNIEINGGGKIEGPITFTSMEINGGCKILENATLTGEYLEINGSLTAASSISAERIEINGSLNSTGNIKTKNLEINGSLKNLDGKIYADSIEVNGSIKNNNELNADRVEIEGLAELNDLFGDTILIHPHVNNGIRLFGHIFQKTNRVPAKVHKIMNIECSTLEASNLSCMSISAEMITLYGNCEVDCIQCDGSLSYSETCRIGRIEGTCTQQIIND